MSASRRRFSQEFKDELCQEVIATSRTIKDVAAAYGVGDETLRKWLIKYRDTHGGAESELTVDERARLKELERENSELRAETVFLKKATAYFAREQRQGASTSTSTPAEPIRPRPTLSIKCATGWRFRRLGSTTG